MRILLLLLIVGLCLVTAKYIPQDSSDADSTIYKGRKSNLHDSDSNTASVERNDDSSKDNDNEDSQDNDSAEKKYNEERNKLREKEEKKKQKRLEKLEKERQKEVEERIKLEEKLAKEQRKEQEKKEKEERKLQERIEKERQKREEEKRKVEEKLEKEERKRQEKLIKQLEKLQKEQKESAEDTYLETEEEDSVEMEDIWKAHVYDKYGISFTSTKLERQAALQRYLQEEMGIVANSTKSERRQAIIKLIESKLLNDSTAVDSFRNLLLSHINAAQMQKLKTKLENELEELNNQTRLLNNISLPWATVSRQIVEEKRTFLRVIAQFLSNMVPNWLMGGETSSNSTQPNTNGIPVNGASSDNSGIANNVSGSGQLPQSVASNDNALLGNNGDGGQSNLNVLPSNIAPGLSSNSEPNGWVGSGSSNSNIPVGQSNVNEVSSYAGDSTNSHSSNLPVPADVALSSSNSLDSNGLIGSGSLNSNFPLGHVNLDGKPLVTDNSQNTPVSIGSDTVTTNSLEPNSSLNNNNNNELHVANGNLPNTPTSIALGSTPGNPIESNGFVGSASSASNILVSQTNVNGQSSNVDQPSNVISSNIPTLSNSDATQSNPLAPSGSVGSDSINNFIPVSQIDANGQSINIDQLTSVNLSNPTSTVDSEPSSSNPPAIISSVGGDYVNNNVSVSQTSVNDLTNAANPGANLGNPSAPKKSVGNNSLNNIVPVNQTDANGLSFDTNQSASVSMSNRPTSINSESPSSDPSEIISSMGGDSINNNVPVSQTDANGQPSNTDQFVSVILPSSVNSKPSSNQPSEIISSVGGDSINNNVPVSQISVNDLTNTPAASSGSNLENPWAPEVSVGRHSLNNIVPVSQTNANGQSSNTDQLTGISLSNPPTLGNSEPASNNPLGLISSVGGDSVNNNVPVSQTNVNDLPNTPVVNSRTNLGNLSTPNEFVGSNSLNNIVSVSQTDANGQSSNTDQSAGVNLSNQPTWANSESALSNTSELINFLGGDSVNNNVPDSQINVNDFLITPDANSGSNLKNQSGLNESVGSHSLNNIVPVSQTDVNEQSSNTDHLAGINLLNPLTLDNFEIPSSNLSVLNEFVQNDLPNDIVPVSQTSHSDLPSSTGNTVISNLPNSLGNNEVSTLGNPLKPNESVNSNSVNNNASINQTSLDVISSNSNDLAKVNSSNSSTSLNRYPNPSNEIESNVTYNSETVNTHNIINQTDGNEVSNIDTSTLSDSSNVDSSTISAQSTSNPLQFYALGENISFSDVANAESEITTEDSTLVNFNSSDVTSSNPLIDSEKAPDNAISSTNVVNNESLASFDLNKSVTIVDEPLTTNLETVTDVIYTNTQEVYQVSEDGIGYNTEAGIIVTNTDPEIQISDSFITSVNETKDVTHIEPQKEQDNFLAQEIVNTPNDLVTVASILAPSPPPDAIVPVEPDASVIDITLQ